jgi:Flp pilus assembly protein TadD
MAACGRLLEIDPDDFRASYLLVGFHFERGEYAEAAAAFGEYARVRPDDLGSRYGIIDNMMRVGALDLARELLTEGLALAPGEAPLHGRLGHIAISQGRTEDARRHLEQALQLDPNHEPARNLMRQLDTGE